MSYCRFGGGSDVYVYHDVAGYYTCCSCPTDPKTPTAAVMAEHLREHLQRGHQVPEGVIEDILEDGDITGPYRGPT